MRVNIIHYFIYPMTYPRPNWRIKFTSVTMINRLTQTAWQKNKNFPCELLLFDASYGFSSYYLCISSLRTRPFNKKAYTIECYSTNRKNWLLRCELILSIILFTRWLIQDQIEDISSLRSQSFSCWIGLHKLNIFLSIVRQHAGHWRRAYSMIMMLHRACSIIMLLHHSPVVSFWLFLLGLLFVA